MLDSSSAFVIDPTKTPPMREPGTLSGDMSSGSDGYFKPVATSPSDKFESPLYDIVFQAPTPWPFTKEAGHPEAAAYARALADITAKLPDLKDYGVDLRQAYVADDTLDYSHSATFLSDLQYPGDGRTCAEGPGPADPSRPVFLRYTREQFCNLSAELQLEFDWLDLIRERFETYETVLTRTSGPEQANLQAIGTAIETAVAPPKNSSPTTLASADDGKPVGDQVKTNVDDLSSQVATNLFNSCRDALYGHTWRGAPTSAQMEWMGGYDLDGQQHQRARFILGRHSLSIRYYAYPPATLTDKMFRVSTTDDGWSVYLSRFAWEQYPARPRKKYPPTDLGHCH